MGDTERPPAPPPASAGGSCCVPGPTTRAMEGDRVRVELVNASPHPHTIHIHGFHAAAVDGVPGMGEVYPGEVGTYDFVAGPFGTHLYHCHSLPVKNHIHRGLYGAFIVDPEQGRPDTNEMVMVLNGFELFRTGTSPMPDEFTDTIFHGHAERHMIEFTYPEPGCFVFHAHQSEFVELSWTSFFEVVR